MSSCFLCDTSCELDDYVIVDYKTGSQVNFIKHMPIMVGSSGTNRDDQQHKNNNKQNYVSYRVKKIEFRCSIDQFNSMNPRDAPHVTSYILIFKVPFRNPIVDYYFENIKKFMLYSEPESVLKYGVYKLRRIYPPNGGVPYISFTPGKYDLIVDKPFILGPNDYLGVLYLFPVSCRIESSAKVWFDVV